MRALIAAVALTAGLCAAPVALAADQAEGQFVARAVALSQFQIDAAQLAQDRAASGEVQAFARQMGEQHRESLNTLQPYVGKTAPAPTGAYAGQLAALRDAQGAGFDRKYLTEAVAGTLGEALPAFEAAVQQGADPAVRDYAKRAVAQLTEQRARAQALANPKPAPAAAETVTPTPPGEAPAPSPASRSAPAAGTAGPGGGAPQR